MKRTYFAYLRIAFGLVWALDAFFKWQPAFSSGFVGYFTDALDSQPPAITAWINWWIGIVSSHPGDWALFIAICETAIAIGLIFGIFTRTAIIGGAILAFFIWAVPEGFGMLFMSGMTDPGAGIIYIFVFVALWVSRSWEVLSIDSLLWKRASVQ